MAWTNSKIFTPFLRDVLSSAQLTGFTGLDSDTSKVALYNDSITPDNDATDTLTAYNTGAWANTNEVSQAGQWAAGGIALTTPTVGTAADAVYFDAVDTASGSAATLASVYGCLVYDDTVTSIADRGVCYNYFGGANSVTNGTFTIVWSPNGIFRFTL